MTYKYIWVFFLFLKNNKKKNYFQSSKTLSGRLTISAPLCGKWFKILNVFQSWAKYHDTGKSTELAYGCESNVTSELYSNWSGPH